MADTRTSYASSRDNIRIKMVDNGDGSYSQAVSAMGRNVEKTSIFNGLAITDTTNKVSSTIDLTKYKQVTFIVINSLDQEVELIFQEVIGTFYGYYNPSTSAWVATNNNPIKVPSSGQRRNILNTVPVPLFDRPLERVTVIARCTTAPTTGALTVYVLGVPN